MPKDNLLIGLSARLGPFVCLAVRLLAIVGYELVANDARRLTSGRTDGLVFGRTFSNPFNPATINGRARKAWKTAGLAPIGLHEARHTYASLMIAAGVNAKALTTYMGHSSVTTTYDRYGHLMPGNEVEAAALLDAYLERANTQARLAQL